MAEKRKNWNDLISGFRASDLVFLDESGCNTDMTRRYAYLFGGSRAVDAMLVLPALVRMKDQPDSIRYLLKSLIQHSRNHTQNRMLRDGIVDQIAAAQIKDGREIELLSKQTECCHIGDPLLVRLFGAEVPV